MARTRRRRTPVPQAKRLHAGVARRIRALRERRGISQEELGHPYLTKNAISSLERGLTAPSLHVLAFLAKRLGVQVQELLPPRE